MYKVAIVDTDEVWCDLAAQAIRSQGFEVSTFADASQFERSASRFDLALIDYCLVPRRFHRWIDPIALVQRLKGSLKAIPILVFTSVDFPEDLLDHLQSLYPEADALVAKQSEPAQTIAQIMTLLEDGGRQAA